MTESKMFQSFYRGNRTPLERYRALKERVEDLEYRLKQAKDEMHKAASEVTAFDTWQSAGGQ